MSFYIADSELEKIIEEDVNPLDLTSQLMDLSRFNAKISYIARHDMVICCTEESARICTTIGLTVKNYLSSGTFVKKGQVFFEAFGRADKIHLAWKSVLRLLEGYSGIATKTKEFVDISKKYNNHVNIVTTRKSAAGTKKLSIKAVISGGAYPHRMGLSETVLIFNEHLIFLKDDSELQNTLEIMKSKVLEKKIGIETDNHEIGLKYVKMGFDFIQLDKLSPKEVENFIKDAKSVNQKITVACAGGINIENIEEYAKTGVDVIVTSSLYFTKPADIKALIEKID
ncbi:modD protein [Methanococcus vannielii SB]|jgi:molybdenum transport protein|uniref:Nicotinate-nucleotide pyrophosphorylase [carboxylating] n=1 Tax=Methanococcus vannielii (strain ATCC 35089 / DSM 1224 / JCM 13029 / OCM 148 / SB) TaxID=406327 RepID=A6UPM9_METVS|nr:ModD protein [Methanococcus vannielii]ABR54451.1 modD protein [Methanococcus vannielii SB]